MSKTQTSAGGRWKRRPIPSPVADQINGLLRDAAEYRDRQDADTAWRLLEDAHVLSQPVTDCASPYRLTD